MAEKAPWPDSTPEEDAAYALEAQMWDMEFVRDVVEQGGPQVAEYVDPEKAQLIPTRGRQYNVQGIYRPADEEKSLMEIERYAPIARELELAGREAPGPDTAAVVGGASATPQIWAHEFGHRRVHHEGGGGNERWRLIHDAFRSNTPTEWADAVMRWRSWNRRRFDRDPDIKNYRDIEQHLKETIATNRNYLLNAEVEAREAQSDVPKKREGFFTIESFRKDQEEQMEFRAKSWSIEKYNADIKRLEEKKASGGKVTMPSKTPEQARLMHAVASGWTPSRMKSPPSRAVAQEFVDADRKYSGGFAENRYWVGGLAPMSKVNAGYKGSLDNPLREFRRGGRTRRNGGGSGGVDLGGLTESPYTYEEQVKRDAFLNMDIQPKGVISTALYNIQQRNLAPPEPTIAATSGTAVTGPSGSDVTVYSGPRMTSGRRGTGRRGRGGRRNGGGRGGRGGGGAGGGGGGGATPPPVEQDPASYIGAAAPAADRESPYRDELRAHQAKIAATLGSARGGHVNYYQEGGDVSPEHPEGPNPHNPKTSPYQHKLWESEHHIDPPEPEEVVGDEVAEPGFLEKWFGITPTPPDATAEYLESIEQARGGRVGYQAGGRVMPPPVGGVPPWIEPVGSGPGFSLPEPEPEQGYQFGGMAARMGPAMRGAGRMMPGGGMPRGGVMGGQYRGVPPQRGGVQRGAPPGGGGWRAAIERGRQQRGAAPTGGLAAMMQRAQQQQAGAQPGAGTQGGFMAQLRQMQQQQAGGAQPGARGFLSRAARGDYGPGTTTRLPPGIDPRAVAADPQGWARHQQEAARRGMDDLGTGGVMGGQYDPGRIQLPGPSGPGQIPDWRQRGTIYDPSADPVVQQRKMLEGRIGRFPPPGGGGNPNRGRPGWDQIGDMGPIIGGGRRPGKPRPGPGMMPPGEEGGGIPGGPRVPPNMRGYLQKQRMMNRPPANVGGAQQQRVGMQDQQGALARAMQRGTGRAPPSRRFGRGRAGAGRGFQQR